MLKITMIRHFPTEGNLKKRYIGITDEPLCKEAYDRLEKTKYPKTEALFTSPLLRCKETASLIYPTIEPIVIENLKECNFGEFENKNYLELKDNLQYKEWIESNGTKTFPQGEDPFDFKNRSIKAFQEVVKISIHKKYTSIALIIHGGTIMSIMERYSNPPMDYYNWRVENGNGYIVDFDEVERRIINTCSIH